MQMLYERWQILNDKALALRETQITIARDLFSDLDQDKQELAITDNYIS